MQNLLNELTELLSKDDRLVVDGKLLKNKITELALAMDVDLIKLLLKNKNIKKHFFTDIEGILVFDKIKFQRFVSNKEFLPDSYTAFKNKIGLINEQGDYVTNSQEVVLAWPYKDCVLEGGQTKEDQKRNEIFWNETLAPDEIDRLLAPKVFTGWKKYDKNGEKTVSEVSENDNLIIKGNNLLGLSSILKKYRDRVKLICIDPPYNTGNDEFNYNDSFNHTSWLTFMKNRLKVAKSLLSNNGSIWIVIDENEVHYLKVICDEIFGKENFITTVIWQNSDNSNNNATTFSLDHNHILVYGKNKTWKPKFLDDESKRSHFKNPDNDPRGPWFDGNPVNNPGLRKNLQFNITTPSGKIIKHPPNGWRWSKEVIDEKLQTGELRYSTDETRLIRRTYLNEMQGLPPSSLWTNLTETGHTRQSKNEQKRLHPEIPVTSLFNTPKPEKLLKKIIELSTDEGDIVVDFFMGSATAPAVAHKMKRKYICFEQMDYIDKFSINRLIQVIKGDNVGISTDINWQGGGSFIYCELMEWNEAYISKINKAKTSKELIVLWEEMQVKAFISYKIDPKVINSNISDFRELSIEDQKRLLIETLDKNQLYVNYSEIDDKDYQVSESDKKINRMFYGEV